MRGTISREVAPMCVPLCALVLSTLMAGGVPAQPVSFFDVIRDVPAAASGTAEVTGDFNGDGIPDLAFNDYSGHIGVFFGNGNGTFRPGPVLNSANTLGAPVLAAADVNGDGNTDLLAASTNASGAWLYVYLGNGDGTFQAAVVSPGPADAEGIAIADFNRDGKPDAALFTFLGPGVVVQPGNGDGSFGAPIPVPGASGMEGRGLITADFTGDGIPDIAVLAQESSGGAVIIFPGKGDGTFLPPISTDLPAVGVAFAAADFDSDGHLDLAVTPQPFAGSLSLLTNNGGGTFAVAPIPTPAAITYPYAIIAADLNRDGRPDIALSYGGGRLPSTGGALGSSIASLLNQGGGVFAVHAGPAVRGNPSQILTADFNGDGKPDLETTSGAESILLGTGDGGFRAPPALNGVTAGPVAIALADFNSDGHPDIVTADYTSNTVSLRLGGGGPIFGLPVSFPALPLPGQLLTGDFNGDGHPDVLVDFSLGTISGYGVAVLLSNGTASLGAPVSTPIPFPPASIVTADFNEDGKLDIAYTGPGHGAVIRYGDGAGKFPTPLSLTEANTGYLAAADLTGAGHTDIVGVDYSHNLFYVWINRGRGVFDLPVTYGAPARPYQPGRRQWRRRGGPADGQWNRPVCGAGERRRQLSTRSGVPGIHSVCQTPGGRSQRRPQTRRLRPGPERERLDCPVGQWRRHVPASGPLRDRRRNRWRGLGGASDGPTAQRGHRRLRNRRGDAAYQHDAMNRRRGGRKKEPAGGHRFGGDGRPG